MLHCCENPKINPHYGIINEFKCDNCGYDDFQDRPMSEYDSLGGFVSEAYHHNENIRSNGIELLDNRKDVFQCAQCKRLYTDKVTCCCGSESMVKVIDASFIKYLNRWKRVEQRIKERNHEIKNSPHDCEKYTKIETITYEEVDYDSCRYNKYSYEIKHCTWCGKKIK